MFGNLCIWYKYYHIFLNFINLSLCDCDANRIRGYPHTISAVMENVWNSWFRMSQKIVCYSKVIWEKRFRFESPIALLSRCGSYTLFLIYVPIIPSTWKYVFCFHAHLGLYSVTIWRVFLHRNVQERHRLLQGYRWLL